MTDITKHLDRTYFVDGCNATALLGVVLVFFFHLDHSDVTFLSSDSPQDYL